MADIEKVIKGLECLTQMTNCVGCPYWDSGMTREECLSHIGKDAISMLKEQDDLGKELTNAVELIHKKNERIKKLEEQIETLTRWRANAGAFD